MNISINTPKTTSRGVQEADVWAAADALIAQGLRPTIERVRQHIGRGSPNTVSPMLETWFAALGQRLGVAEAGNEPVDQVPEPIRQAAEQMWNSALEQAKIAAESLLQAREAQISAAEEHMKAQQQQLAQREEVMQQQKSAMDEAMKLAHSQAQELSRRLEEMQQLLQEREAQIQNLRNELLEKGRQREIDQQQHAEALQAASLERQRLAEQFTGNERRMLGELDRARQEVSASKKQAAETERRMQTRHEELHERFVRSEESLVQARGGQLAAEQALKSANERISDLKALAEARDQVSMQNGQSAASTGSEAMQQRIRATRSAAPAARLHLPAKTLRKNRR